MGNDFSSGEGLMMGSLNRVKNLLTSGRQNRKVMCYMSGFVIVFVIILWYLSSRIFSSEWGVEGRDFSGGCRGVRRVRMGCICDELLSYTYSYSSLFSFFIFFYFFKGESKSILEYRRGWIFIFCVLSLCFSWGRELI